MFTNLGSRSIQKNQQNEIEINVRWKVMKALSSSEEIKTHTLFQYFICYMNVHEISFRSVNSLIVYKIFEIDVLEVLQHYEHWISGSNKILYFESVFKKKFAPPFPIQHWWDLVFERGLTSIEDELRIGRLKLQHQQISLSNSIISKEPSLTKHEINDTIVI